MSIAAVLRASALAVFTLCSAVQAGTIYVSPAGNDANNGSNWATAKKTVQAGLNAAQSGDQVWVAAGTYIERITLKAGVALYGGFAGSEAELAQRNWAVNITALDGNQGGSVVTAPSGATAATRIDGFTIRNGKASNGGGVYCSSASPTITNNTITGNSAYNGGGLYLANSSPTVVNNTVTGNSASQGGGLYLSGFSPTIANNTITGNSAYNGGGLYLSNSTPAITNNTITSNTAFYGGGLCLSSSSPTIANTIIACNSSGIYRFSGGGTAVFRCNCVYGNGAYDYSGLADPTGTSGNIKADPKVAGLAYGNLHIQADSPCIDSGSDADVQSGWLDMDGQPRQIGRVDIGADESDGTTWPPPEPNVIVRVSPAGSDANDGSSWALAKKTVQAGINTAAALGGEVWVAAGTYYERITLQPYAYLYGGFAGTETQKDQRDWAANITILDGQQGGSVVSALAGHRVSTIDGFTICNGKASYGGGLYLLNASPTIANNTITGNSASNYGGGLYLSGSSSIIVNNTITSNGTSSGGGLYLSSSSPTITNNTIARNSASSGGGLYLLNSAPTITNSTIASNSASSGGGLYLLNSAPTITNNTIASNGASSGGGLYLSGSSPTVANTIIAFNSSGICNDAYSGTAVFRCNCIYGNAVDDYSGVADPTGTSGNIKADPKLADSAYGAVPHLQPDSPCIDSGSDADVQSGWLDMDGQPRQIGRVDIGADESDGTTWPPGPNVIVRVSPAGNDANDGSSWALAKKTVQAGINAAAALGGEVWVAAGTYYERITLQPYAYLYGGFAGTETQKDKRNWATNVTILDGQQGGSVVSALAGHRVSTIDGFTICNGKASYGGGLYLSNASPTIANNTITGNSASSDGGGLVSGSFSTIINNIITGNSASRNGGGLVSGSSTIINNIITGNSASRDGGGLVSGSSTIINNTITGNSASRDGGGLYLSYYSSPTIANTIVAFNSSGIYSGLYGISATPVLRCNCVYDNAMYDYLGVADPTGTSGNIKVDPKLAGLAYGDAPHLQPDSPCIDSGSDSDVQAGWLDMDGQPRQIGRVDIGADESDGTTWPPPGPNVIVRVNPAGNDANDGSSWALAKKTVQAGINAAAALGGEVWVAAGTYYERITLAPCAHLYGGFAGTETQKDQRNWATNVTILDGQQGGSVVSALAGRRVSTIDGFTIRNGKASSGGGLYLLRSSPTIANNTITGNSASTSGGGLYLQFAAPRIANNVVTGNSGLNYGGGLYLSNSSPTVINCTIAGNSSNLAGGLYLQNSSPTIANSVVTLNSVVGIYQDGGTATLRYNCVYGNAKFDYIGLDPTGSDGNISIDPGFVRATAPLDVHLAPGSPCINAGDPTYSASPGETDVDGQPRIMGGRVDMGACEYKIPPGDINADGTVNVADFESFRQAFGHSRGEPEFVDEADYDNDGLISFVDYQTWLGYYRAAVGNPLAVAPGPLASSIPARQPQGDANVDGCINVVDLQILVMAWATQGGQSQYDARADFNNDGYVNIGDLMILVRYFGTDAE